MSRLFDISLNLGVLYKTAKTLESHIAVMKISLDDRKLYLTPPEGWEGNNEQQRKLSAERICKADKAYCDIMINVSDNETKLADVQGDIQAFEAERRALEWDIRKELIETLSLYNIQRSEQGPIEETAFDDVMMNSLDGEGTNLVQEAISALAEQMKHTTNAPPGYSDIGF